MSHRRFLLILTSNPDIITAIRTLEVAMAKAVTEFINAKKKLLWHFNCREDYFVKPILNHKWKISITDDIPILTYWEEGQAALNSVIIKKMESHLSIPQPITR